MRAQGLLKVFWHHPSKWPEINRRDRTEIRYLSSKMEEDLQRDPKSSTFQCFKQKLANEARPGCLLMNTRRRPRAVDPGLRKWVWQSQSDLPNPNRVQLLTLIGRLLDEVGRGLESIPNQLMELWRWLINSPQKLWRGRNNLFFPAPCWVLKSACDLRCDRP